MVDTAAKVYYIVYKHCEKQMNNSRKMSLQVRALSRDMDKRNTAWCDEMEPKNRFSTLLELNVGGGIEALCGGAGPAI